MVDAVRAVEKALGDGWKRPTASEIPTGSRRGRASWPRDIRAGELLSADNLTTRRPGNGVSPLRWDEFSAPRRGATTSATK